MFDAQNLRIFKRIKDSRLLENDNFTTRGSTFWNSRTTAINRRTLIKQEWYEKKVLYVTDLMDEIFKTDDTNYYYRLN